MDQCYSLVLLAGKGKYILEASQPKRREEKSSAQFWLLYLYVFLFTLNLPYVNWASQESCLFYLSSSLWSLDLPLFCFCNLIPSLSSSHDTFGLLFPILTT